MECALLHLEFVSVGFSSESLACGMQYTARAVQCRHYLQAGRNTAIRRPASDHLALIRAAPCIHPLIGK